MKKVFNFIRFGMAVVLFSQTYLIFAYSRISFVRTTASILNLFLYFWIFVGLQKLMKEQEGREA